MKPERHVWDEGSTHRAVAGKEYDEVWDYAEELEAELEMYERDETFGTLAIQLVKLEAELEKIICHWCEAEVTEDEANEHYKSCTKNPLRAENEALKERVKKTLERARCFASDEVDVGMNHQIGRWLGIAEAHKETLALLADTQETEDGA